MTEDDVRALVRSKGSQREFARQAGVHESTVSYFLSGRIAASSKILAVLGLERIIVDASCNPGKGDL